MNENNSQVNQQEIIEESNENKQTNYPQERYMNIPYTPINPLDPMKRSLIETPGVFGKLVKFTVLYFPLVVPVLSIFIISMFHKYIFPSIVRT